VETLFLAQEGGGEGSGLVPLLMIVLLFAVMYFLLIRPQQKRRREALEMQSRLAVGDEVVTIGGLYATVAELDEDGETVILETSEGVYSRYARAAISRVVSSTDSSAEPSSTDSEPESDSDSTSSSVVEQRDAKD
jgi:preprotein translocase subunit YajC